MTAPIRLLLLEDKASDAELMLGELERASLDVTARRVETEDEFRRQLSEWTVDVILADYGLPTFDGEAALRIAREIAAEVPFIFVSGSIGEERAILALQGGATDYILKDRMSRLGTAVIRALDERKQRELRQMALEALQESEERFRSLAELAGDAIILTEGVNTIVFANEHAAWMFGLEARELIGRSKMTLLAEHVREEHERVMESLRTGDDSAASLTKKTIGLRQGKEFPLEMSVSSWRRHGQLFFTTILRDVSDRVATERRQEAQAARLREAQHLAHVGNWDLDLATGTMSWSEEVYAILGIDADVKPSAGRYMETVHPGDRERIGAVLESQQRTGSPETIWFQHRIIRPDGSERTVECRSRIVVDEHKIVNCVIATIQDVTETQALERNLELAKRIGSLGRVAATIAHEFNNVMMGIEPFAEMIRRQAGNDVEIVQAAEQISVSVRRGRRVTEEILRFTQPAEPELRGVDLREWLRDLGPELRALAGSVRVTIKLTDSAVYIACDAAQLQQVVTNLLLNARDASPEGSEITITLARVGREHVEMTVRDEGTGIPPNSLEHIFEPLFTTKRTGTGLGLSVARQIVTRHGGSIEVTNRATGGAEFRMVLPATKARPSAAPPQQQPIAASHLRRILLVEDDDLVAAGLTALLEMEGMAVLVISRGLQVVDAVESFEPDAVILDLTLPDVNGIEVFRELRRRWPHLPVLFSTGHGGSVELAAELSGARVELLRKPYEIGELLSALQRIAAV